MKKHNWKKPAAALLCLTATMGLVPVSAASPTPTYDETLYLTLDHYGVYQSGSVVKAYNLNGNSAISDHGLYHKVINMTNYAKPQVEGDTVSFDFTGEENLGGRFYFEGTFSDEAPAPLTQLPWSVDVSYALNGVPTAAEDLAGASGLVDITIDILPNKSAPEYYRNNMVMEIATMLDSTDVLSVSAEGGQIQTVGSIRAVLFFALPGEEQHYTLSIGTENFSFSGLMLMMQPVTLAQLDKITDLREAKETLEDSANAISDSMDIILNTMESMTSGLRQAASGLDDLNAARGTISAGKGQVYSSADAALADLDALADALAPLNGHLTTAQGALTDVNTQMNDMVTTMQETKTQLSDTRTVLTDVKKDMDGVKDLLGDLDKLDKNRNRAMDSLTDHLDDLKSKMDNLSMSLGSLRSASGKLTELNTLKRITQVGNYDVETLKNLAASLEGKSKEEIDAAVEAGVIPREAAQMYLSGQLTQTLGTIDTVNNIIKQTNGIIGQVNDVIKTVKSPMGNTLEYLEKICDLLGDDPDSLTTDLIDSIDLLDDYMDAIHKQNGNATDLVEQGQKTMDILTDVSHTADTLIDQLTGLQDIMNAYEPQAQQALEDAKVLSDSAVAGLKDTKTFLSNFEALMKAAGGKLDSGSNQALSGLSDTLRKTANGMAQTGVIRGAKNTVEDTIRDEWDKHTGEETNILNMDPSAPVQSMTSEKNEAPTSLQVVLRTQEITNSDDDSAPNVDEEFHSDGNFFTRLGSVFQKIWHGITGFFH